MHTIQIANNINVFCVKATSFPAGIMEAFEKLHSLNPTANDQPFYGISYFDENGNIVYKAATAERFAGEGESHGLETFVITQGTYLAHEIKDFRSAPSAIGDTFRAMLADDRTDKSLPCIEWYNNTSDLICMMKLL
jgi:predicted transcriptional regulator YdeE